MVGVVVNDVDDAAAESSSSSSRSGSGRLIFTYGTLKKGFSNHVLMQELIRSGDARFMGLFQTAQPYPLVCGPYRVPFLLNLPGSGQRVLGELYAVSPAGLARLDDLEGTTLGHYERLPIDVDIHNMGWSRSASTEAYFAHRSYALGLWEKNGNKGLSAYSESDTVGYVRRKDRPQHLSFLDHIRLFLSSSPSPSPSPSQ
ncbi:hypothetical protein FEM48_Zijuj03G0201200 [Ziziphus jujuba var. spinosa]|uniref:Gamma-glutamylcyclotransferase family protein n=1 Tax=Ziziphus jujuba var. spinosa TaxID=714518 RepID=A0A978VSD1_ZIZJJ|nr:hypothetical protein FEM48_Zijuj03G0201200 [Ziziphus jujuba var. spinosa]